MTPVPTWITKSFLETALKTYFHDDGIEIIEFSSVPAIPIGENYTSDLLRTSITYKTSGRKTDVKISVIIKLTPQNEMMNALVKKTQLFKLEADMYTKVFPAFSNIIGDAEQLSAKCVCYTTTPHSTLIFEDLTKQGFQMYTRQRGLDLDHCLLVIKKLAYFHAASLVLHQENPTLIESFQNGIFRDEDYSTHWILRGFKTLINVCSKWQGYEKYADKLKAVLDRANEKTLDAGKVDLNGFNVLNHGDTWINNFMFSYTSDGKPEDFRFVDLQLCKYTSPSVDLHYFWATSPNLEVKKYHLDTIFDKYYTQLVSILESLQYPLSNVPTKEQLRADWNSRAFYGLTTALSVLPIVMAPKQKEATFQDFLDNDSEGGFRDQAYHCEQFMNHMQYLLPFYEKLGVFDD